MLYRLFTLLILLLSAPAWGATYTVCASGCSQTTIQSVFDNADLGADDIVEVRADTVGGNKTYNEDVLIGAADSGTSSGVVTVQARSGDTVTIKSMRLLNVSYITINGLTFSGATNDGFWINSTEGNNISITVSNCISHTNGRNGFYIEDDGIERVVNNILFSDCLSYNNASAGFHIYSTASGAGYFGSAGVQYLRCISDGNGQSIDSHGFSSYLARNVTYTDCIARNQNKISAEGHGFVSDDHSSNITFLRCQSYDNEGHGIIASHLDDNGVGQYNKVIACLVYRNQRGITVSGAAGSDNVYIDGNTVYGNDESGITLIATINSAYVRNNLIAAHASGYAITADEAGVTATISNNLTNGSGVAELNNVTNANGVTSDPVLIAPASGNFGIAGNSPAKDAGAVLYTYAAHPGDFIGAKVYGSAPDIGAIEYQDHTFGGWFFEMFIPTIFNLCASTNANCYTQP